MKAELHQLLRRIKQQLPAERRDAFVQGIRSRLAELDSLAEVDPVTMTKFTICGMAAGAVLDLVPGAETLLGVDGFVDVGAALGAFAGLAKSASERRRREAIRAIIIEEINRREVTA